LEEEAAIRNDLLFMKYFSFESPLLPPANQQHTCHPDPASAGEGSPSLNLQLT
jgi:hypothetical protein